MQEALNERDELKLRVHSYISEVARIESLMAAKVRWKEKTLQQIEKTEIMYIFTFYVIK